LATFQHVKLERDLDQGYQGPTFKLVDLIMLVWGEVQGALNLGPIHHIKVRRSLSLTFPFSFVIYESL
jgi:hypothetical protein